MPLPFFGLVVGAVVVVVVVFATLLVAVVADVVGEVVGGDVVDAEVGVVVAVVVVPGDVVEGDLLAVVDELAAVVVVVVVPGERLLLNESVASNAINTATASAITPAVIQPRSRRPDVGAASRAGSNTGGSTVVGGVGA